MILLPPRGKDRVSLFCHRIKQTKKAPQVDNSLLSSITTELLFNFPGGLCNLLPEDIAIDSLQHLQPLLLYWCHPGSILTCWSFSPWKEVKENPNQTPALTPIPVHLPSFLILAFVSKPLDWVAYFSPSTPSSIHWHLDSAPQENCSPESSVTFRALNPKDSFQTLFSLTSYSIQHSSRPPLPL